MIKKGECRIRFRSFLPNKEDMEGGKAAVGFGTKKE